MYSLSTTLLGLSANPFRYLLEGTHPWATVLGLIFFALSVYVWTLLVTKAIALRKSDRADEAFVRRFRVSAHPLACYATAEESEVESFLEGAYRDASAALLRRWMGSEVVDETFEQRIDESPRLSRADLSIFRLRIREILDRREAELQTNLTRLACLVATIPLLGLLAGAWGLMVSFGRASLGSASVNAGMAASVAVVVVALLVTLPALVGTFVVLREVRAKIRWMNGFCTEFQTAIEVQYGSTQVGVDTSKRQPPVAKTAPAPGSAETESAVVEPTPPETAVAAAAQPETGADEEATPGVKPVSPDRIKPLDMRTQRRRRRRREEASRGQSEMNLGGAEASARATEETPADAAVAD